MTHEQLVVLQAIVTTGTFRAAAERLNKSQSAISHMLKKLEEEIGIVLLSREEYRPKLTAQGKVFYRHATRVLQQMQQLGSVAKNLTAKQEAEVFLAVTATYPLKPLLNVIREATEAYPATHIHLSRESMSGPIERLLQGDADIIVATTDGAPMDQVEAVSFASVKIIPVAHPDYEPAQNTEMNSISEMQSYIQVVVADSGSGKQPQSRDLLPGGLRWTVSDFAAKKDIILEKMGWGGLPEHLVKDEIDSGKLVPLNVEGYPPRQSHLFQMRARNRNTGIVAQFIWERLTAA
ncbi:LysR family transcriptional regulator [Kiloniella sp. EL199]|uniref:LysR family transcriptional regulator n=1 Tax=Kiloniella sp. EL199 TaxID=2107581 RepID=UPI000EA3953E|nr:LysR family transcriptional regulator [Kiloniella sp. EL199]